MSLEEKFIVKREGVEVTRTLTMGAALIYINDHAQQLETWTIETIPPRKETNDQ